MESCANCFGSITDMRKETRCQVCGKPLHKDCAINDGGTFCDVCYTVQRESVSMAKPEIVVPDVIRRSYIELYKRCPYAFYMTVIKGVETGTSCFAQVGIDLHDLFHKACLGEISNQKELLEIYKPTFDAYKDELFENDILLYSDMTIPKLREKMWKQSEDAVDVFFNVALPQLPTTPLTLEENIIFGIGDDLPEVSITMDRVDEVDGMLEVCDWKTGAVMVGQKISSDLQAPLYIYAIREHFKKSVRKFTFYYLPENKIRIFERVDDDNYVCKVNKREYKINITDAIREVQSIFAQIIKGNFNIPRETKKMYFSCKTCGLKHNGICKGAETESWLQHN